MSDVGPRIGAVDVAGHRLRYAETGQGPVLVHLAGNRGSTPTSAHALLTRRFRLLALEPLAPTPDGDTTETLAAHLAAALRRLDIDSFDLIGSSASSATAVALAAHAPDRVRALVLESPPGLDGTQPMLERPLAALATPTLALFGTEDTAVPADTGRRYKALVPGSHLVFVYAAGHAIAADRPEAFVEVVSDFLERHEAFVVSRARTVILP